MDDEFNWSKWAIKLFELMSELENLTLMPDTPIYDFQQSIIKAMNRYKKMTGRDGK